MTRLNSEVRRLLKKSWLWLVIIVASASVWLIAFYWASQTPSKLSFEIWVGAESNIVDDDLQHQLDAICKDAGMKEFAVRTYNPADYFYPQAFALEVRSVEIFILGKDEAASISEETHMFRVLSGDYQGKTTLEYNGATVGVEYKEDYFVLINNSSKKNGELLLAVLDAIVNYEVNE